jgi:hypothetical protein
MNPSKIRLLSFITLFLTIFPGHSIFASDKQECKLYEVIDIELTFTKAKDPFGLVLKGQFTGPNNEKLEIPGFYNGEGKYIIRFSPVASGTWKYITLSSEPKLSGKSGEVICKASEGNYHGAMVIDPENPKRFRYQDGTPYFLSAFEFDWLFALDLDNPDDIPRTRKIIDRLAENGFNHIVMNVYADDVSWQKDPDLKDKHEFAQPGMFPFMGSNSEPDFSVLNVEFFKRLDRVIGLLAEKNIIAHLMIYVWNKEVNWPEMYTEEDNMYFDYVIKRYQAFPNIVWDISKEALSYGRCDMDYVNERIERVRRNDAYKRLLTVHDYGYCQKFPEKVDFISIQTWQSDLYNRMRDLDGLYSSKPVFNIEHGGYEKGIYRVFPGDYTDAVTCLERNYLCLFGGAYATYYWQNTSWNVIVYDMDELSETDQPKMEYYKYLSELFERYDYSDLSPANRSTSGYCLSDDKGLYMYFIPSENYAIHTTIKSDGNARFKVTWFNPLTGEYSDEQVIENSTWKEYIPYWKDQPNVLILEGE